MFHWEVKTISNHYKRGTKELGSIDIAASMEYAIVVLSLIDAIDFRVISS